MNLTIGVVMFSKYFNFKNILKIAALVFLCVASNISFASVDKKDVRHSSSTCSMDKEFVLTCDYRYSARLDVKDVTCPLPAVPK